MNSKAMAAPKICLILMSVALANLAGCVEETGEKNENKGNYDVAKSKIDMDEKGPDKQPIIFWRIKQEDRDGINELLDAGYNIEITGGFSATPIIGAALIDDWITVLLLLKRGANALAADRRGFTMTYFAKKSKVDLDGRYGVALTKVREFLKEHGVNDTSYEPSQVKDMLAKSKWPPAR